MKFHLMAVFYIAIWYRFATEALHCYGTLECMENSATKKVPANALYSAKNTMKDPNNFVIKI